MEFMTENVISSGARPTFYAVELVEAATRCAAGSRIFQPLITSQSGKSSSTKDTVKRKPRWTFG